MTPEQIARRQTAWTVFRYERQMYDATWALMQLKLHDLFAHNVCNAIVESHSLHIRNLCEFLASYRQPGDHLDLLDHTDLVERFEEIDVAPLRDVWLTPITGHPGSPAWVLQVMSDCTIHRRKSYDYSSIATAIHGPLVALMDQIERVQAWEIRQCRHDMPPISNIYRMTCPHCGASAEEVLHAEQVSSHRTPTPEDPHETEASETTAGEAHGSDHNERHFAGPGEEGRESEAAE